MPRALRKAEGGFILAVVLIGAAILLILGTALLTCAIGERRIAHYQQNETALYYIAEAGLEAGQAVIGRNFDHRAGFGGTMGEGAYTVNFVFPGAESDLERHQRKVVSTGVHAGETLTLELISRVDPIYGRALTASEALTLSGCTVDGAVHANGGVNIEGVNTIAADAGFSCAERQKIGFSEGAVLWVKGCSYSGGQRLPAAWETGMPPLPPLDLPRFADEGSALNPVGGAIRPPLPACCRGGAGETPVNGSLVIAPGKERLDYHGTLLVCGDCSIAGPFHFDGRLIVFGNLTIFSSREAPVCLNGFIGVAGAACIHGAINRDCSGQKLALAAGGEIAFSGVEPGQEEFGGGPLFLFSGGGAVRIGDPANPRFDLYGVIAAVQVELYQCHLHHAPEVFTGNPDLPGSRVVIEEWLKP